MFTFFWFCGKIILRFFMKEFLPYDVVRNDALKLAHKILKDGFVPDVIYCSLRGGAYMANVISEYFKIARKGCRPVLYSAVVARSYTDIRARDRVMVDGWTYSPEHLRPGFLSKTFASALSSACL